MREAEYTTIIRVANRPEVNLFTNPNAQISLAAATATTATLSRVTPYAANQPYDTSFALAGSGFLNIGGDNGALRNGMQAGTTYTARGTVTLTAPLGGTISGNARKIQFTYRTSGGVYVDAFSAQAPNVAGTYDLSVTVTIPAGATEAFVRFYNGHTSGSLNWYRLRLSEGTQTDFFDGDVSDFRTLPENEYGWDGPVGLSTSWRIPAGGTDLIDAEIEQISYDRKRVPFIDATITLPYPGDAVWALLDPRVARDVILYFNVQHEERNPATKLLDTYVSHMPRTSGAAHNGRGKLWLRTASRDYVAETVTLRATSGEVRFEDKKRLAAATADTGATTAAALWEYALTEVGEIAAKGFVDGYAAAAIPAGDRRLWMQGESASELFEGELASTTEATRSYCDDRGVFSINQLTQPPTGGLLLVDFEMTTGDLGTIVSASQEFSRDNGWADATLVKAQYINASGVQQTAYQNDTLGANRAGKVRTINRAIPSSTLAAAYTREAQRLGDDFKMTALADFNCTVERRIKLTLVDAPTILYIAPDRITYRVREGLMDIEGHIWP